MEKVSKEKFEKHLCERGDVLDNAAYDFLCTLAGTFIEWDIPLIREVIEFAESGLRDMGVHVCDPYYTTEIGDNGNKIPVECCNAGDCYRNCPLRNDP